MVDEVVTIEAIIKILQLIVYINGDLINIQKLRLAAHIMYSIMIIIHRVYRSKKWKKERCFIQILFVIQMKIF